MFLTKKILISQWAIQDLTLITASLETLMIVAFVCSTLPYSLKKAIPGLTLSTVGLVTIIIVVITIIIIIIAGVPLTSRGAGPGGVAQGDGVLCKPQQGLWPRLLLSARLRPHSRP